MPAAVTPMIQQYLELKEKYSDCLLFFRLGDFYEMFFEDALTASRELEIVLTGRNGGLDERVPMCGVPYHSVDSYINRLISKGYRVAICEQLTDPAQSKGLVERDVIRVVTPGTVIEETMLDERRNNYIVALFIREHTAGLAYADVSTGSFTIAEIHGEDLAAQIMDELARLQPSEVIANEALFLQAPVIKQIQSHYYLRSYEDRAFHFEAAQKRLKEHFQVHTLAGYSDKKYAICAAGALMRYLADTQKNALSHIRSVQVLNRSSYMLLDVSTRRNLELTVPLRESAGKKNTLLYLLDDTQTAMGGRMLRSWIEEPLQSIPAINRRLDAVEELTNESAIRQALRDQLNKVYDIERLCSRIAYGSVNARDCLALRETLKILPDIVANVQKLHSEAYRQASEKIDVMSDICLLLCDAIVDRDAPVSVKEGGIIRDGYNSEVDKLRDITAHSTRWLEELEASEREKTKIKNLKIGYNRVFGYYIEVSKANQASVPYHYVRKQTLANAERYVTDELKELETTLLGANDQLINLEYELFCQIRQQLMECIDRLQHNAVWLAELDVYQSFACDALRYRYCRPELVEESVLQLQNCRHPVVEQALKNAFIPNSAALDPQENRLLILTGPNMAGKSTYMRQIALITLMAHIGCFVPADTATIGLTDRIFTRVGASDDLAGGQSTFMVEMSEVANIVHNATSKSLLILDEIGRGTSTFDGLSIAWSVLEHIADIHRCGARTLFATHYHELTELEGKLDGVKNYRISVKEVGDDILFLHKIVRGGADKSFGIQVARMAGLPDSIIARAKEILEGLESQSSAKPRSDNVPHPVVVAQTSLSSETGEMLLHELSQIPIDDLTAKQALDKLYDLRQRACNCLAQEEQ